MEAEIIVVVYDSVRTEPFYRPTYVLFQKTERTERGRKFHAPPERAY